MIGLAACACAASACIAQVASCGLSGPTAAYLRQMKTTVLGVAIGLVLVLSGVAHALITERVIVMIGVQLTDKQAKAAYAKEAELEKAGLRLVADPSLTEGNNPPPSVTWAGVVLATTMLQRNKPTSAAAPLPTADQIEAAKKLLAKYGLPAEVKVVALVEYSGGK